MKHPRIGVFDSGVGGQVFVNAIKKAIPDAQVTYLTDTKNIPYGSKTKTELLKITKPLIKQLAKETDLIVIACNTVSTLLIEDLRKLVDIPLVAVEPMVKTASSKTKSKIIAVCATPATLSSPRYKHLKNEYATGIEVIEPDCSEWSAMIQANELNMDKIESTIKDVCNKGADVIVLGCTHYHWIEKEIDEISADKATVLQPEQAVILQVLRVLEQLA